MHMHGREPPGAGRARPRAGPPEPGAGPGPVGGRGPRGRPRGPGGRGRADGSHGGGVRGGGPADGGRRGGNGRHGRNAPGGGLAGLTLPAILVLLARGGETHGYALRDALEASGLVQDVDFGNLYRTLRRLEEAGLVASRWEMAESGPGRRMYALRPEGRAHLEALADPLAAAGRRLQRFLTLYEEVRTRGEGGGQG